MQHARLAMMFLAASYLATASACVSNPVRTGADGGSRLGDVVITSRSDRCAARVERLGFVATDGPPLYLRRRPIGTCRLDSRTQREKQHCSSWLRGPAGNRRWRATRGARRASADAQGCNRQNRAARRLAWNECRRHQCKRRSDLHSHEVGLLAEHHAG